MEPGQFPGFPFGGMGGPGGGQAQGGGGGMPPGFPGMMGAMGCGGGGQDGGGMPGGGMGGGMPGMGGMSGMGGMAGMAAAMGMGGMGGMGGKGGMGGLGGMPGMGNLQGMAGMQNFLAAMSGMPGMGGGGPPGGMPGMAAMMNMFPDQDGSRSSGAGLLRGREDRDEGGSGGGGNDELSNEVRDFVDKWSLEQRFETRLIEQLRKRGSSWQEDLGSLGRTLQDARSPPALLSVKLREMEEGTFEPGGRGGFGGGGGGGGEVGMCYDFKQGICDRGDRCRFSHGAAGGGKGGGGKGFGKGGDAPEWMMDDIRDFCDKYNLDDRLQRRLSDAMKSREKTFKEDMRSLGEVLATARNPPGLLSVKLREMEDGTFVAKGGSKGGDRFGGDRFGGDRHGGDGGGRDGGERKGMTADRKRELFGSLSPVRKRSRSKKRRNRSDSRSRRRRSSRS